MMNLISFETPPLGRHESTASSTRVGIQAKEASSSTTCFHCSDLDLSLGISLPHSHGGGGSCDAAGCCGTKASNSGDVIATANDNAVRAGYGRHDTMSSSSWTAAFMPSPTGFMHPWSLAARQQKAAAEQDRSLATATYVTSDARVVSLPAAAVGWPPVHTARRHLVTAVHVPRPHAAVKIDGQEDEKVAPAVDETDAATAPPPMSCTDVAVDRPRPTNMFAKVHMDGCLIGRKINLRAHRSYESLSRALTKMIRNFFCPANYSSSNSGEDCANSEDLIFLYEDFEGDRMLVGDVPWELFLASAKRLYIAQNPTSWDQKGNDEAGKLDPTKEATNN